MTRILVQSPNGEIMLPCTNERNGVLCGSCHKFFAYPITVGDKCPHCNVLVVEAMGDNWIERLKYQNPITDEITQVILRNFGTPNPVEEAEKRVYERAKEAEEKFKLEEQIARENIEVGVFIVEATPMLAVTFHDRLPFVVGVNKIDYDNPFCSASHTVRYTLTFNGARDYAERLGFKFVPKAPRFVCACFGTYIDDKDL